MAQQLTGVTRGTQAEFSTRPLEIGSGDASQTKLDHVTWGLEFWLQRMKELARLI